MPILHTQITAQGRTTDGKAISLAPVIALIQRRPIVQVMIGVEQNIAQQLLSQGIPIPQPIPGVALIDTGATLTCIDDAIAKQLN